MRAVETTVETQPELVVKFLNCEFMRLNKFRNTSTQVEREKGNHA